MARIRCEECGKDISDRADACPGCGAPRASATAAIAAPLVAGCDGELIVGTRAMLAELARAAVIDCGYRIDQEGEGASAIAFTTGMTMGSWAGVSGTVVWQETAPHHWQLIGSAKQNVRGGQVLALNLFGEAQGKIERVTGRMRDLAVSAAAPAAADPEAAQAAGSAADAALIRVVVCIAGLMVLFAFAIAAASAP